MSDPAALSLLQTIHHNLLAVGHMMRAGQTVAFQREVRELLADPRFDDPLRLERRGFKVYSQTDEDGILQAIFERIGTTDRRFVEFGVGNGMENNTAYLLAQGWSGLWIEGSADSARQIGETFARPIAEGRLALLNALVHPHSIDALLVRGLEGLGGAGDIDLLSIDIDGNDHHVFAAMRAIRPRVVVAEYNAKFHPPMRWVMPYNETHVWDGTDHFGASLSAYEDLYRERGYSLVGCNIGGLNAFFVRSDLAEGRFAAPFTAENHHHPARYHLVPGFTAGHPARRFPA